MFRFMSAIVLKDGEIMCAPELTHRHDDLIKHAGVDDTECVRIRFTPPDVEGLLDPDRYELMVVQRESPGWFDLKMRSRTADVLRDRVRAMIITGTRPIILSGCWIVAPYGYVGDVVAGRIVHVAPGAVVRNVLDRAVIDDVYGTVVNVQAGGVVHNVRHDGTVVNVWGTVHNVWGVVGNVRDGGRVTTVREMNRNENTPCGQVGDVCPGGVVGNVWGTVGDIHGVVGNVGEGGRVGDVYGVVDTVWKGGTTGRVQKNGVIRVRKKGAIRSGNR